ncbi:hypothetical protein EK21DRAFT_50261, partial [Setomelanomma holmii]
KLQFRQQPLEALVCTEGKEKSRKPIDPPPIVQVIFDQRYDPNSDFLRSPYVFTTASLENGIKNEDHTKSQQCRLTGTLVSSLHCLKDTNNKEGGFFIFGDISVKDVGTYRLRVTLHELAGSESRCLGEIISEPFRVVLSKDFKGLAESTHLSRSFSDQGVRLRLRKDARGMNRGKRSHSEEEETVSNAENKKVKNESPYAHSLP